MARQTASDDPKSHAGSTPPSRPDFKTGRASTGASPTSRSGRCRRSRSNGLDPTVVSPAAKSLNRSAAGLPCRARSGRKGSHDPRSGGQGAQIRRRQNPSLQRSRSVVVHCGRFRRHGAGPTPRRLFTKGAFRIGARQKDMISLSRFARSVSNSAIAALFKGLFE